MLTRLCLIGTVGWLLLSDNAPEVVATTRSFGSINTGLVNAESTSTLSFQAVCPQDHTAGPVMQFQVPWKIGSYSGTGSPTVALVARVYKGNELISEEFISTALDATVTTLRSQSLMVYCRRTVFAVGDILRVDLLLRTIVAGNSGAATGCVMSLTDEVAPPTAVVNEGGPYGFFPSAIDISARSMARGAQETADEALEIANALDANNTVRLLISAASATGMQPSETGSYFFGAESASNVRDYMGFGWYVSAEITGNGANQVTALTLNGDCKLAVAVVTFAAAGLVGGLAILFGGFDEATATFNVTTGIKYRVVAFS